MTSGFDEMHEKGRLYDSMEGLVRREEQVSTMC
jgi:hypothetical protein